MATIAGEQKPTIGSRILDRQVERLHRTFADHKLYSRYVDEISEPMFRQFVREGQYRSVTQYAAIGLVSALALPTMAWWVAPVIVAMVPYYNWSASLGQCVEWECLFRHREGKWRWEQ